MQELSMREGTFALSAQQLTEEQQHLLAKSLSAMLCQRAGMNSADPLLGNSRSSSPYIKPQEPSTTSGSLDTACMQLPPPAMPMHARPSPLGGPQHQHLQQHVHDSQCSHSSAHGDSMPAGATPFNLFKTCRLGDPCCYGSPVSHEPTPSAGNEAPAFTVEEPLCLGSAAAATACAAAATPTPAPEEQQEGSPVSHGAAACQDIEMEAPAVTQQQQPYRRPSVMNSPKAWLYELVTCSFLFKACPQCSATNSGREVLITYFDTDNPTQGYCTYCPQRHVRPHLLQVSRGRTVWGSARCLVVLCA